MRHIRLLSCLLVLLPCLALAQEKKIVAYVTSWTSITPDPNAMTHINYAFGGVGSDYVSVFVDNKTRLQKCVELKKRNPKLKVLLSIGGWGRGNFSPMAADATKRQKFAKACRAFCDANNVDGIDIDWEFPGDNSSGETSPTDEKQNYTLLMRDLREALGSDLLLTMASQADPGHYDFRACIGYLDFVNVMTYDMSGQPNHHSALYRGGKVGNGWMVQHEGIQRHLQAGIPASKLVMGLAFYGNSGQGSQISLQAIKDGIASGKWTDHWDDVAKVPYVTDSNGTFAYGYDDDRSLTIKCQYIVKNKLAGGMYWEYANDDNAGTERRCVFDNLIGSATRDVKIGATPLAYSGYNTYSAIIDMEQDNHYTISGIKDEEWDNIYVDPDFFAPQADGTFAFLPLEGRYRITADFFRGSILCTPVDAEGQPLTYNATDGSGAVWVIGATSSVGKPTYAEGSDAGWSAENAMPMAHIAPNRYQLTLTVGKQLNASMVNFKFFHAPALGTDAAFTGALGGKYRVTLAGTPFMVSTSSSEDGNIKLRSGKTLEEGQTYVFTLDTTSPTRAKLSVSAPTTITNLPAQRHAEQTYDLLGRPVHGKRPGRIVITRGRKVLE